MTRTFDYIKYDETHTARQADLKQMFEELERKILVVLPAGKERSLALNNLEVVYMWVGKAIKYSQLALNDQTPDCIERTNI